MTNDSINFDKNLPELTTSTVKDQKKIDHKIDHHKSNLRKSHVKLGLLIGKPGSIKQEMKTNYANADFVEHFHSVAKPANQRSVISLVYHSEQVSKQNTLKL